MDLMASIFAAWIVILMLLAWQTVHKRYKIRKPLKMSRGNRVRQRQRCSSNHCWYQKPFVTCMTMQNEIVQYRVHGWEWHPFSFSSSTQSRLLIHLLFHFDAVDFLRQGLRKYMAMLMCMNGWHELIFCLLVGSLAGSCVAACTATMLKSRERRTKSRLCKQQVEVWLIEPIYSQTRCVTVQMGTSLEEVLREFLPVHLMNQSFVCCNGRPLKLKSSVDTLPANAVLRVIACPLLGGMKPCFLTMPGAQFEEIVLLPADCIAALQKKQLIEELQTEQGGRRFAWCSGISSETQWHNLLASIARMSAEISSAAQI